MQEQERTVVVCDRCLQASCWQGIFMCQESGSAGIKELTLTELKKLNLEHPDYWRKDTPETEGGG